MINGTIGEVVPVTVAIDGTGRRILFTPDKPWAVWTSFSVRLERIPDWAGNSVSTSTSFFTTFDTDTVPPTVESLQPADGAAGLYTNTEIRFRMSEVIHPSSTAEQPVELLRNGVRQTATLLAEHDLKEFRLQPKQLLVPNSTYSVHIQGLFDLAGNRMAPVVTSFSTGDAPEPE